MSANDQSREAIARDPAMYRGALSVGVSGPLSAKMHCTVWLEGGKVKQASVANTYVPPTKTIGIRPWNLTAQPTRTRARAQPFGHATGRAPVAANV